MTPPPQRAYADFAFRHSFDIAQEVDAAPLAVLDAWIDKVFVGTNPATGGDGAGAGRGRVGLKRHIVAADAYETILAAAGLDDDKDGGGTVPSLLFNMGPFGSTPWSALLSLVEFVPVDGGAKTNVKWGVKTVPKKLDGDGDGEEDDAAARAFTEDLLTKKLAGLAASFKK
ncbi:hypothetical protein DFJ73DRAFT_809006, partial [Zopfochytrium polystomum]